MLCLSKTQPGALRACLKSIPLVTMVVLAACSSGPRKEGTVATPANASPMKDAVAEAICKGNPNAAVEQLSLEPLMSPTDTFYMALSLELSGHPTRARLLYANAMQSGSNGYVRVRCGKTVYADGSLSEESARRLAIVSRDLAILDANLRPNTKLPQGIPYMQPAAGNKKATYKGPALNVGTPGSQSPFGQWFAHLASYSSLDSAVKNKSTLEGKFPALSGIIDQWEVAVNGKQVIRLGIRVRDKSDADDLCQSVKSNNEYCAVIDTSQ